MTAARGLVAFAGLALAVAALICLPGAAEACSVCFQGGTSEAARVAFIASTAAMTFLPLAVVGGVAWWVRRRFVRAELDAASRPFS